MFELTVDQEHINLIKKALQSYLCSIYDALDNEVVDINKAHEDIKIASDMLAVLKGQNGYRQTSESVCLMWMKEVNLFETATEDVTEIDWSMINTSGSTGEAYIRYPEEIREHAKKLANIFIK
jgi:hypothetical protein